MDMRYILRVGLDGYHIDTRLNCHPSLNATSPELWIVFENYFLYLVGTANKRDQIESQSESLVSQSDK